MKPTLFIIRGLPGSGNTALAELLVQNLLRNAEQTDIKAIKTGMDEFFTPVAENALEQPFDSRFLGAAHDECYGRTMRYLRAGYSVAVANNFSTRREVERYTRGLGRCGLVNSVDLMIIKCAGTDRVPHTVPEVVIDRLRSRWEDVEGEILFNGEF